MSSNIVPLRSDYCPECHRVGRCGGEQECRAYREHVDREFKLALERFVSAEFSSRCRSARRRTALIERGEQDD